MWSFIAPRLRQRSRCRGQAEEQCAGQQRAAFLSTLYFSFGFRSRGALVAATAVAAVAITVVLAGGCGRTPTFEGDGGPDDIGLVDGSQCAPSCNQLCQLASDCNAPIEPSTCLGLCQQQPDAPEVACLEQLICSSDPERPSCNAASRCITDPTGPDLVGDRYQVFPDPGQVTITARVCNRGRARAAATVLRFYAARNQPPKVGDRGQAEVRIRALEPNDCEEVKASAGGLPPGSYRSWLLVDATGVVVESNEDNNVVGPRTFVVPPDRRRPDLRINSFSASGSTRRIAYSVTVCNVGQTSSPATTVGIYYNRNAPPPPNTTPNRALSIPALIPGACTTRGLTATNLAPGLYRSWAYVDYRQQIPESNENNNITGPRTTQVSGGGLPDLRVSNFQTLPSGTTGIVYRVTVCNIGQSSVGSSVLSLYYNRNTPPTSSTLENRVLTVGPLGSGGCTVAQTSVTLSPGTYRSWAFIDRKNAIVELNEGNNLIGPAQFTVGSTGQPDLIASAFSATVQPNGNATYFVTVCNVGKANAGASIAAIHVNRSTPPSVGQAGNRSLTIPSLVAGQCRTRSVTHFVGAGTHNSWVFVDRTNSVKESNESNNVRGPIKVTVSGGLPDLQVINFTSFPSGNPNFTVYQATICNFGQGPAGATRVGIYYNRPTPPPPGATVNRSIFVSALVAGACTTRSTSVSLQPGTYTSWAFVDYQSTIAESNEGNNVKGPLKVVVSGGGTPDLFIASFGGSVSPNGSVSYFATICNQGSGQSGSNVARLYYNLPSAPKPGQGGANRSISIPPLAAGQCVARNTSGTPQPGVNLSWLIVDALSQVNESNENNNTRSATVLVPGGGPDLVITAFTATPSPVAGVFYGIQVCNTGQTGSGATSLALYYNRSTPPSTGAQIDASLPVPALSANACHQTGHFANLQQGSYTSWARVDPANQIKENNENNNLAGPRPFTIGNTKSCTLICETLVKPCGLLPANQLSACIAGCQSQSASAIACAEKAASAGKCFDIVQCLFGPVPVPVPPNP